MSIQKAIGKVHQLPQPKGKAARDAAEDSQLKLPLERDIHIGKLIFADESEIQPSHIENIVIRDGVVCVADLRQVPFFSGDNRRHDRIQQVLLSRNVPVYHLGVACFNAVDQSLPTAIKLKHLSELVNDNENIKSKARNVMESGACLFIIDNNPNVLLLARMIAELASNRLEDINIKLNSAWSRIARQAIS